MNDVTPNQLKEIRETDQFLLIPFSAQRYAKSLGLSEKATLAFFYVTGLSIKRLGYMNQDGFVRIRFSLTKLISSGMIKTKSSASKAINELREKGVLEALDTNEFGTAYKVCISEKIFGMVVKRNETAPKVMASETHFPGEMKSPSKKNLEEKCHFPGEMMNADSQNAILIQSLQKRIAEVSVDIAKRQSLFSFTSLKDLFKSKRDVDLELCDLLDERDRLERRIDELNNSKPKPRPTLSASDPSLSVSPPASPRVVSKTIVRQAKHLIDSIKGVSQPHLILNQVVWAIRFGWYANAKMGIKHALNHAIKLVRNNDWRTPFGFNEKQIIGLVDYCLR